MQTILTGAKPQNPIQYAGFWRRLLAAAVDGGILSIIGLVMQSSFGQNNLLAMLNAKTFEDLQKLQVASSNSPVTAISFFIGLAYLLIFWVNYDGATPGKKMMGIKITKDDGSKLTYTTGIIRYFGTFISFFFLGLGYLWVIWDHKKQAWHDKIANTVVVKTEAKPKTLLAIFLSLVFFWFNASMFGVIAYKSYSLGMAKRQELSKKYYAHTAYNSSEKSMSDKAKTHYDRSQELFKQIRENRENPERVKALNDENIKELKQALETDPKNPVIWNSLGNAYTWISSEAKDEDSLNAYQKAEQLDPNNVVYVNNVGQALVGLEKYDDAVLQLQKAFRIDDNYGNAHYYAGIAYYKLGVNKQAREHFQKAIKIYKAENSDGFYDSYILEAQKVISSLGE